MESELAMNIHSGSRVRLCALYTACFTLIAHGYRYLSMGFSGDAALISQAGEEAYQISLGRFLQPLYWQIRGYITAPLVIGLFATAFLIVAAASVTWVLGLTRRRDIALVCGLLAASETFAVSNATYLPWTDVYALSLMLSSLGTAAFFRWRFGWLLVSPVCFFLSLSAYQSYLAVAAALLILACLLALLRGERTVSVWLMGIRACVSLLLGLALYALVLQGVLSAWGLTASQDYNGVGRVGMIPLEQIAALLRTTYLTPLRYLFDPASPDVIPWHVRVIPAGLNLLLLACAAGLLVFRLRRARPGVVLTALFLLAVFPLGVNFVEFIAQGIVNGLMIYAYGFFYVLCAVLTTPGARLDGAAQTRPERWLCGLTALLLAAVIGVGTVAANQMAFKRDLEYASTLSVVTRILDRAEQTEGYVPGETPVVLVGILPSSPVSMERPGFEAIARHQGMRYTYAASYETSTYWYLQMALGAKVNLVSHEERRALSGRSEVEQMPVFPQEGCCAMIDGKLYIRIN